MFIHEYDDRLKDDTISCYNHNKTSLPQPSRIAEPVWVYTSLSKQNVVLWNLKPALYWHNKFNADQTTDQKWKIISEAGSMESKSVKNSNIFLFGFSFNLILTLASLGFTSYSLHRLESRVAAVEQDLLALNHPYRLDNHGISKLTFTHSPPISESEMNGKLSKRAVDGSSLWRKCNRVCLNSKELRKVRRF